MYGIILALHNIIRWVALILGIVAAVLAWLGWLRAGEWKPINRRLGSFFGISVDIQFLLGLLLYFFLSPLTRTALMDFGAAMGAPDLRFFALVHPLYMILGVIFAHLGSALPRRLQSSTAKFRSAAIWTTLAVLFILLGMPWGRPIFPGFG
jgi:hypothetical protein